MFCASSEDQNVYLSSTYYTAGITIVCALETYNKLASIII